MADTNIAAKVEKYLALFDEIRKRTSDDRVAQAILVEVAKDRRMDEMKEEREAGNSEPATAKQLQFMRELYVEFPTGVTKRQASELITSAKERGGR